MARAHIFVTKINMVLAKRVHIKAICFHAAFEFRRNDIPLSPPGCDKCVWDLTDDLRLAALSIEESKSGLLSVSSGAAAHRHVNEMNSTIHLLKVRQALQFCLYFHYSSTGSLLATSVSCWHLCCRLYTVNIENTQLHENNNRNKK